MIYDSVKKCNKILLGILSFLLPICIVLYLKFHIKDLFIDEYYTFNFSNAYYFPLLYDCSPYSNMWLTSDFWNKLVNIQDGSRFCFDSVYYNTAMDVHPPIYYFIFHFFTSCFPGVDNVWLGLGVNVLFFCAVQVLIYNFCDNLWHNNYISLLVCVIYGFSLGTIEAMHLIRMYMVLIFLSFLYYYIAFKYVLSNFCFKFLPAFYILNILGYLTHYYFILFSAVVFFVIEILMYKSIKTQKSKSMVCFFLVCVCALLTSIVLFPETLEHIFGTGYNSVRGVQHIGYVFSINNIYTCTYMIMFLLRDLPVWGLFLLIPFFVEKLYDIKYTSKCVYYKNSFLFYSFRGFIILFFVICCIIPFYSPRYMYFLYPVFLIIILYSYIQYFILVKKYSLKIIYRFLCVCVILTVGEMCIFKNYIEPYPGFEEKNIILREVNNRNINNCLLVLDSYDSVRLVYSLGVLTRLPFSYITIPTIINNNDLELGDNVLIMVADNIDLGVKEQTINKIVSGGKYSVVRCIKSEGLFSDSIILSKIEQK